MKQLVTRARQFFRKDEEGATMVEYALMVTFVAIVALVGVTLLGVNLNVTFNAIAGHF